MREEVIGLEESFKLAPHIMTSFAKSEIECAGRDSSVELYLLNHWVKDFSLRDLIDRVSTTSASDDKYFLILMKWLMDQKLSGNSEERWAIEDFRKLAVMLAKNLRAEAVTEFFS